MVTKNVTDENFESEVLKSEKLTLVDFWAEWCGPCKQIGPILEEISDEMKNDVIVAKHNIDENPNQPTKYGVRGIPTMLLFKSGELKATKVGATTKSNIVSWIKENIQFKFNISPAKYKLPVQKIIALLSFFEILLKAEVMEFAILVGIPQDKAIFDNFSFLNELI